MSDRRTGSYESTATQMMNRYDDPDDPGASPHHKHDKRHHSYRLHSRSHSAEHREGLLQHEKINGITAEYCAGHSFNYGKRRKRLPERTIH